MKFGRTSLTLFIILTVCFAAQTAPQSKKSEKDFADRLFQSGKFAEAGNLYSKIVTQNPKDHSAILQLGRIALLSNRLDEAQKWFGKVLVLNPGDTDAKVMLALEALQLRNVQRRVLLTDQLVAADIDALQRSRCLFKIVAAIKHFGQHDLGVAITCMED